MVSKIVCARLVVGSLERVDLGERAVAMLQCALDTSERAQLVCRSVSVMAMLSGRNASVSHAATWVRAGSKDIAHPNCGREVQGLVRSCDVHVRE